MVGQRKHLADQGYQPVKERTAGTKDARKHDQVYSRALRRVNWCEVQPEPHMLENCSSALGQHHSSGQAILEKLNLTKWYAKSFDTILEKLRSNAQLKLIFRKEWYRPHPSLLNPRKPGKLLLVCNTASKL